MRTKDLVNLEEAVNKVYLKEEESYEVSQPAPDKTVTLTPKEEEVLYQILNNALETPPPMTDDEDNEIENTSEIEKVILGIMQKME